MDLYRESDGYIFHWMTGGIRKPIARFLLPSGREVELLSFHLEPAFQRGPEEALPNLEVISKLYPNSKTIVLFDPEAVEGSAFVGIASLCSELATTDEVHVNCSYLVVCDIVQTVEQSIAMVVSEMLAKVDWDANAENDFFW